jgi:hypothetical protein
VWVVVGEIFDYPTLHRLVDTFFRINKPGGANFWDQWRVKDAVRVGS